MLRVPLGETQIFLVLCWMIFKFLILYFWFNCNLETFLVSIDYIYGFVLNSCHKLQFGLEQLIYSYSNAKSITFFYNFSNERAYV